MNEDLFWIRSSPSLMNIPEAFVSGIDLMSYLDVKLDSCNQPIATGPKLGIYYEDCIQKILRSSPKLIDLYRGIQVLKDRRTLGEFDFIGAGHNLSFHIECAVKFYIRTGSGHQLSDYIGPGKRDRLDLKWQRMLSHQLPLSTSEEGILACLQYGLSPDIRALLMQGYLFHPLNEQASPLHPAINNNHLRGWWIYERDTQHICGAPTYQILEKPFWLHQSTSEFISFRKLAKLMENLKQPALIRRLDKEGEEIDRGFILNNDW